MCAPSTCAPASACGSSTPFRSPANSATTPGRRIPGPTPATPACGARLRSTKSSAWSICRSNCRPAIIIGGHRPGNGLFGESLVAVDLKTGKRKWHYQLVHHGVWDMDIPCAPILADITVNGKTVKAVAQPTKQSFLYVFDRVTGEPSGRSKKSRCRSRNVRANGIRPRSLSRQAAGLCASGRRGIGPDRLHAGTAPEALES